MQQQQIAADAFALASLAARSVEQVMDPLSTTMDPSKILARLAMGKKYMFFCSKNINSKSPPPENGWLEDEMSFWDGLFLVSGRVTSHPPTFSWSHPYGAA